MFDILLVLSILYFIGSALIKRSIAAQKKAGGMPPRRPGGPHPPGAPPWARPTAMPQAPSSRATSPVPEAQPAPEPKRSAFETLYEAAQEQLDLSAAEGKSLPRTPRSRLVEASGSLEQFSNSYKSDEIMEGPPESRRYQRPDSMDAASVRPVELPGLGIRLNADTLVQGVIFSEILNRKGRGMRR